MQGQFLPRIIRSSFSSANSADSLGFAEANNSLEYLVKQDGRGHPVRASEWICSSLARHVGIPTAPFEIVQLPDTTLAFGSQLIGGLEDESKRPGYLTGTYPIDGFSAILAAIYAFDLFIGNEDRHGGNYLFAQIKGK